MQSGNEDRVLVLAHARRKRFLSRILNEMGLVPVFLRRIRGLLEDLHVGGAAAIVMDRDQHDVDLLELLLNIRDLNSEVPVIVIGKTVNHETEKYLASAPGVYPVPRSLTQEALAMDLHRMMKPILQRPDHH